MMARNTRKAFLNAKEITMMLSSSDVHPILFPCDSISKALSLRKQVESIKKERAAMGIEVDSPCGPGAPCRARLEAMEVNHRKALQELQCQHEREIKDLEEQRDTMLQQESQAAAKGKSDSSVKTQKLRRFSF